MHNPFILFTTSSGIDEDIRIDFIDFCHTTLRNSGSTSHGSVRELEEKMNCTKHAGADEKEREKERESERVTWQWQRREREHRDVGEEAEGTKL